MKEPKAIAVDFDGVIHKYSKGYQDGKIYDEPMEGAVEALKTLGNEGYRLYLHTTRPYSIELKEWMTKHGLPPMEVARTKPKAMIYIDDRGIRFTSWKDILNYLR